MSVTHGLAYNTAELVNAKSYKTFFIRHRHPRQALPRKYFLASLLFKIKAGSCPGGAAPDCAPFKYNRLR